MKSEKEIDFSAGNNFTEEGTDGKRSGLRRIIDLSAAVICAATVICLLLISFLGCQEVEDFTPSTTALYMEPTVENVDETPETEETVETASEEEKTSEKKETSEKEKPSEEETGETETSEEETEEETEEDESEESETSAEETSETKTEEEKTSEDVTILESAFPESAGSSSGKPAHTQHVAGSPKTISNPTCVTPGSAGVYCTVCGELLYTTEIKATGTHTHSGMHVVQQGSLSSDQVSQDTCTVCGAVLQEERISYAQQIASEQASRGSAGRLLIPDVGINVAIFRPSSLYATQPIVDAADSACIFDWPDGCGNTLIADHSHQGFSAIKAVSPGATVSYIVSGTTVTYRCCFLEPNGYNEGSYLAFNDHSKIGAAYPNRLLMYTCNSSDGYSVTISVWDRIN